MAYHPSLVCANVRVIGKGLDRSIHGNLLGFLTKGKQQTAFTIIFLHDGRNGIKP